MSHVQEITAASFESQVLQADQPVLVDFYAKWCMPCRVLGPVLDDLATRLAGRAKIVKVDTDAEPELAAAFRVSSIPTLYIIHQGKVVDRIVGMASPGALREKLEPLAAARPVAP